MASWNIWDEALDFGVRGTKSFSTLFRPVFGDKMCPHCGVAMSTSYQEHLFSNDLSDKYPIDEIIIWLNNGDQDVYFI